MSIRPLLSSSGGERRSIEAASVVIAYVHRRRPAGSDEGKPS